MSTKYIGLSALAGRKISFFFTQERVKTIGYVVDADDYHWLVAGRPDDPNDETIELTLVHKSAAGFIVLHPEATLEDEPLSVKEKVKSIGSGFWHLCEDAYLAQHIKDMVNAQEL